MAIDMSSERMSAELRKHATLPIGVDLKSLQTHADARGNFTEIFREEWRDTPAPVQWNLSANRPNVLRGVHVHARHWDYLCVVAGELTIGLHDMRPGGPTRGQGAMLRLTSDRLTMVAIPPGVAHGFYSPGHSTYVIGASRYYDPADHRRCRWDCPELKFDWPCTAPDLSTADRAAPGYGELTETFLQSLSAVSGVSAERAAAASRIE